jgi:hypothetical protein
MVGGSGPEEDLFGLEDPNVAQFSPGWAKTFRTCGVRFGQRPYRPLGIGFVVGLAAQISDTY